MRKPRIKPNHPDPVYHCISRIVGEAMLLDDCAKEKFRQLMWERAAFCGIEILTYSIMSTHFHILARVPQIELSDEQIIHRVETLYGPESAKAVLLRQSLRSEGKLPDGLRNQYLRRMGDLSVFMKELKQNFSRWFNKRSDRVGALWAERFKSPVVEPVPEMLRRVAGYIDLNAVRAGLVKDPKDYRFCGYTEALSGRLEARAGLVTSLGEKDWANASSAYREYLFVRGVETKDPNKAALSPEEVRARLTKGIKLGSGELLLVKVRYFSDGLVLGSRAYVEEIFQSYRSCFGKSRKSGARPMRGGDWGGLCAMRDLRVRVFG